MKRDLAALVSGVLFGLGLGIGGMTQQTKIIGFLDFTGAWDPSLNFVMLGAVAVSWLAVRLARRRVQPLFGGTFQIPTRKDIDARLVVGAVLFGVGWGLGGYCPGPAFVSMASLSSSAAVFLLAMVAGMQLFSWYDARVAPRRKSTVSTPAAARVVATKQPQQLA